MKSNAPRARPLGVRAACTGTGRARDVGRLLGKTISRPAERYKERQSSDEGARNCPCHFPNPRAT